MTAAAAEDRERVGPYRVIRAIGAGGSARIDLARIDRAYGFQRHVVIKRPLEHLRANPEVAASLRREARIGGQLRHPNLVAILDAGIHEGYDYLILEYIHGAALRSVMQTETPGRVREIPLAVALAIVAEVARGMHEAHELTGEGGAPLGLVHRDVSPGNILLGLDGSVKLADFGIAKETRVSTLSGSIHGTVTYMAPEQCQGHAFDRRADVFSLGVILYELLTGIRLFWADNDVASLHRVLSGSVPRPRKIRPQLPAALEDIVLTAVAHEADKRYPTALELAIALELHAAGAGEVLGARWIARVVEGVVGPKQEPWIATTPAPPPPAAPEASPGDGSLVELIAAAGPDEPIDSSFGDAGEDAVSLEEPGSVSPARVAPAGWSRRARITVGVVVALGLLCGVAVAALVIAHSPEPASSAASNAATPASAPAAPANPVHEIPPPAPPSVVTSPPRSPATIPASPTPDLAPTTVPRKRRHATPPVAAAKAAPPPAAPSAAVETTAGGSEPRTSEPAPAVPAAPPPATRPPPSVEWKPTMLLPTDGSAARPPR